MRRSRNTSALISSRSTSARTSLTDRSTWCVSARLLLPLPPSFRASLRHALPPPHLLYPSSATSSLGARQSIASGSSLTLFSCPIRLLRGIDRTAITDLAFLFFAPQHFTSMLVRTLPSCLPSPRPLRAFLCGIGEPTPICPFEAYSHRLSVPTLTLWHLVITGY